MFVRDKYVGCEMKLGQTTVRVRRRVGIDRVVVSFVLCFFAIVGGTVVTVAVLNAGRNVLTVEALSQEDPADIAFANFRGVTVGNLKDGMLYRSASPVNNTYKRASVVDRMAQKVGIQYIVNLSDNIDEVTEHINKDDYDSPYYLSLHNAGKEVLLDIEVDFRERNFGEKLVKGLVAMTENEGPYLVHCVEGKDRTGFVMMILEALTGASYKEMVDDYMLTYDNYSGINQESNVEKYEKIKKENIDAMLHYIIGDKKADLTEISDYSGYAKDYLKSMGMSEESIEKLVEKLSK